MAFVFLLFGRRAGIDAMIWLNWNQHFFCRVLYLQSLRMHWLMPGSPSHDQKQDLETQKNKLESYCQAHFEYFEVLTDLGSGLNYKKPSLKKLLRLIFQRQLSQLVINHKDRLLRFGADLVFELCHHFGVEVIVLESPSEQSFEMELAADVIELMTVFSSRLYGRRSHQNRKRKAA